MTLPVDIRLPAWGDCALKVNNYAWREKEGHTHLVEDCPSALERFIFEYEDADPLKEKQFREMLLAVVVELTQPLTAREIDLSERTSQRDAWRERAFKAETSLTARDKALDAANKLWRLCVDEGWPWADGETQDALTELGLLVPRDMKAADAGEPCESCYGDCDTCYQAIDKLEDLK